MRRSEAPRALSPVKIATSCRVSVIQTDGDVPFAGDVDENFLHVAATVTGQQFRRRAAIDEAAAAQYQDIVTTDVRPFRTCCAKPAGSWPRFVPVLLEQAAHIVGGVGIEDAVGSSSSSSSGSLSIDLAITTRVRWPADSRP